MRFVKNPAFLSELAQSVIQAYGEMELSARLYAILILLPAFLVFLATVAAAALLDFIIVVRVFLPLLGLLIFAAAVGYPRILLDQRRVEMENWFHLFIIHMMVLASTNIDRMEVMRKLADEQEYGALAVEMQRVVDLVDVWHLSLGDAFRRRAKAVPSESVEDLFERMAYSLEAGQELEDFLEQEQDVLISQYTTVYRQSLTNLDVLKDLYLSMIISMTFALVFAVVLPLLTGDDPALMTSIVIVLFVFVQLAFAFVIRAVVPTDPIWYLEEGYRTKTKKRLLGSTIVGVGLSVFLVLLGSLSAIGVLPSMGLLSGLPQLLYLPLVTLPLLIPGFVFWYEEKRVFQSDRAFPDFIRSLGTTESARQSTTSDVLASLRTKNFGPLTPKINDLYKRLNMRLSTEKSWRLFTGDTHSFLIQKFSEMYLIGRDMGGTPKHLGELISTNMNQIINLREERRQNTTTLIGVLYGITIAATFAFFIGVELSIIISEFDVDVSDEMAGGQIIHTDQFDVPLLRYLIVIVLIFNAFISSLILRLSDGGHLGNSYLHFTILLTIGALTGVVTEILINNILSLDV